MVVFKPESIIMIGVDRAAVLLGHVQLVVHL